MISGPDRSFHDTVIEGGIRFLLIFTPLAFGSVQSWAAAVMQLTAFVVLCAWILKMIGEGRIAIARTYILLLWGAMIILILLQLVPMPISLLDKIAPSTARLLRETGSADDGTFHPLSLHPQATKEELFNILAYFSVFLVVIHHFRTEEKIKMVVKTVIVMGCSMVVFAVIQKMTWNGKLYWIYPLSSALESNTNYIWGPYINHNHFAGYLELAAPLAMGMLLYYTTIHPRSGGASSMHRTIRFLSSRRVSSAAVMASAVAILNAGILASLSRGAIAASAMSAVFFLALTGSRRTLRRRSQLLFGIGLAIALILTMTAWDRITGRFGELSDREQVPRFTLWTDAVGIIRDHPVLGSGAGTFNSSFPKYQTKYSVLRFEHAENDYLEIATDLGLLGFSIAASLCVVFFVSLYRAWRKRKNTFALCTGAGALASCFALAMHSAADFNLRIPANAMLVSVIAGIAFASVHYVGKSEDYVGAP